VQDRIAVPTVRLSFNAMMLQMAAEQLWGDPHRLDHLTVALGHPDAVTAPSAHIGVQPFTDRGLKLPGAHVITDSRKVFGGPLTQITLLARKQTKEKNPTLFQAVANALGQRSGWRTPTSAKPQPSGRRCRRPPKASTTWSPS
jgi:NitT/TauT family transport system substrate-binding protein